MKTKVAKISDLKFSVTAGNKAAVIVVGEVPTSGWSQPELANDQNVGGVLHVDFVAEKPAGSSLQVLTPIEAQRDFLLSAQEQQLTIHSETNEKSITLPAAGDPR